MGKLAFYNYSVDPDAFYTTHGATSSPFPG